MSEQKTLKSKQPLVHKTFKASTDFKHDILPAPEENLKETCIKTIKDMNDSFKKNSILHVPVGFNPWNWLKSSQNISENYKPLELKLITQKLGSHRMEIYTITKSVESVKTAMDMFLHNIKVSTATQKVAEENSFVTYDQLNNIINCAETLLKNINETLLRQSETLKSSFDTLNKQVHKTFDCVRAQYFYDDSTLEQQEILPETSKPSYLQPAEDAKDLCSPEIDESKYSKPTFAQPVIDAETLELNEQVKRHEHEIEQLKHEISNLQSANNNLQSQNTDSENYFQQPLKINEILQSEKTILQSQNADSENRFQEQLKINAELANLKSENESLRGKKESQVQLHFEGTGELIMKAIDELKSMLVQHLGIQRRELKFIHCPSVNDVDPDIPLMVICINVSRIGTDVHRTLHHLNASKRVALLILHHKDVHALPSQASERVLTGVDFQSLDGIFDLAFLAEKGLYRCEMNTKAANGIANFIHLR